MLGFVNAVSHTDKRPEFEGFAAWMHEYPNGEPFPLDGIINAPPDRDAIRAVLNKPHPFDMNMANASDQSPQPLGANRDHAGAFVDHDFFGISKQAQGLNPPR